MSEHHYVERTDSGAGTATGLVIGILVALFLGILALFLFFGGPGRFVGGTTTPAQPNTNINVQPPAQQQPQSGPNINVPRQIDINVNPPAQQPPPPANP